MGACCSKTPPVPPEPPKAPPAPPPPTPPPPKVEEPKVEPKKAEEPPKAEPPKVVVTPAPPPAEVKPPVQPQAAAPVGPGARMSSTKTAAVVPKPAVIPPTTPSPLQPVVAAPKRKYELVDPDFETEDPRALPFKSDKLDEAVAWLENFLKPKGLVASVTADELFSWLAPRRIRLGGKDGKLVFGVHSVALGSKALQEGKDASKVTLEAKPIKESGPCCPKGHLLVKEDPNEQKWQCDQSVGTTSTCKSYFRFPPKGEIRFRCQACNYDLCQKCWDAAKDAQSLSIEITGSVNYKLKGIGNKHIAVILEASIRNEEKIKVAVHGWRRTMEPETHPEAQCKGKNRQCKGTMVPSDTKTATSAQCATCGTTGVKFSCDQSEREKCDYHLCDAHSQDLKVLQEELREQRDLMPCTEEELGKYLCPELEEVFRRLLDRQRKLSPDGAQAQWSRWLEADHETDQLRDPMDSIGILFHSFVK